MNQTETILFRASGAGALMTNKQGSGITEIQLKKLEEFDTKITDGKTLTEVQKKEYIFLKEKKNAKPELSQTAKNFVKQIWLQREKGIYHDIKSKYLDKGTYQEEDAITLLVEVEGIFYTKNEERRENCDHTGECDIIKEIEGKRIVIDTKCSWNAETFMNADDSADYEWQGRVYMELWDAEEFHLKYCLVDCPPHLVQKEKEFAWRKYYADTMTEEEQADLETMMQPIYAQIERNLVYSNSERFTKEERVKTFVFYRDKSKMNEMAERVKMAREYYNTITLNGNN